MDFEDKLTNNTALSIPFQIAVTSYWLAQKDYKEIGLPIFESIFSLDVMKCRLGEATLQFFESDPHAVKLIDCKSDHLHEFLCQSVCESKSPFVLIDKNNCVIEKTKKWREILQPFIQKSMRLQYNTYGNHFSIEVPNNYFSSEVSLVPDSEGWIFSEVREIQTENSKSEKNEQRYTKKLTNDRSAVTLLKKHENVAYLKKMLYFNLSKWLSERRISFERLDDIGCGMKVEGIISIVMSNADMASTPALSVSIVKERTDAGKVLFFDEGCRKEEITRQVITVLYSMLKEIRFKNRLIK